MINKQSKLSPDQIIQFKAFVSQQLSPQKRKLTGDEMSKLKKAHFNQYIKKIKYYAQKDLHKIKENNAKFFYGKNNPLNYQNKLQPHQTVKKQKPSISPQISQKSYYYFGKAQLASMKEFIFLAQECHRIQHNLNKFIQRKKNQQFIKNVQQEVQTPKTFHRQRAKSVNLHLTLKAALKIQQKLESKQQNPQRFIHSGKLSFPSSRKSLAQTNFTIRKNSSVGSLRPNIFKT